MGKHHVSDLETQQRASGVLWVSPVPQGDLMFNKQVYRVPVLIVDKLGKKVEEKVLYFLAESMDQVVWLVNKRQQKEWPGDRYVVNLRMSQIGAV
jgi:hypothetical protein